MSSRTHLNRAIWKLLSWASLRWQQCCLSHGLRLVCWTGFGACRRRYVSFSHVLPRRSPTLSLSRRPNLNLSPSRRLSLLGTRHDRARMCRIGPSWIIVYRQGIGVTTHDGFVIRHGAGQLSAGAITVFEVRASISSRKAGLDQASTSVSGQTVALSKSTKRKSRRASPTALSPASQIRQRANSQQRTCPSFDQQQRRRRPFVLR